MDARIRKAVSKIAAALEFFVDDIDPRSVFLVGNTTEADEHAEWVKNRRVHYHQARHVMREFGNLALQPMMISPTKIPAGTESPVRTVDHRFSFCSYVFAFEWYAKLVEIPATPVLIERLLNAANAFDALGLECSPLAAEIDPDSLNAIRQAAKELHDLAAFVPSGIQTQILDALNGCAMIADELELKINCGRHTLYGRNGSGGLNELMALGMLRNERTIGGYFRPDKPPLKKAH